jgi:archaellum biogenesis ATPase FlaH
MPIPEKAALSLRGFLSFLYDGLEGYIYAPTLDRSSGEFRQVFVKTSNLDRLEAHIKESALTTDVYIAPAVFSEPKVSKQTFAASNVVWCEFDGNAPTDYDTEPTLSIESSLPGHQHNYWRLDEAISDFAILEEVNRGLAFTLEADKSGWDCTQILRPPETHNFKRDKPVGIDRITGAIYNIGDFVHFTAPPRMEDDAITIGTIPDVMDVIFKHPFPEDFRDLFSSKPAEGSRSTYMMRVGYVAAETGCSNEEIYALIRNFDERVGKYTERLDRHRRLLDIIERVRVKYPLEPEGVSESFDAIEVFDIISFGHQTLEVKWLIPSLLQEGGNMLLVGPPGVGKTQVALNFAYGLATGSDILNYTLGNPRRILFVSCEMGPVDLKVFTDQMTSQFDTEQQALLRENFFVFPHGEPMYLNTPAAQEQLKRMIDVLQIDGFIFDSLGSATNKALTDEESTKGLLDFNDTLRKEMGVFSWFIHHNRKATENNKEPSGLADVYGSQYITARATTVLSLWPQQQSILKVRELKKRLAASEPDWYIKREAKHLRFRRASEDEIAVTLTKRSTIGKASSDGKSNNNPYAI